MEIVSSRNHRYTPDTESERSSLGAYRFECTPRQGKRNIGTRHTIGFRRYASFLPSLSIPTSDLTTVTPAPPYPRNGPLRRRYTVRFSPMRRWSPLQRVEVGGQKFGPPTARFIADRSVRVPRTCFAIAKCRFTPLLLAGIKIRVSRSDPS